MPASRAASALPPTATVRRPKVVRFSSTQPAATTTARMMTSSGMPRTLVVAMLLMVAFVDTWVCLPEICAARPRAATSMASVAMKGTSRPYEMSTPLTSPTPMPTTSAVKIMPAAP